MAEPKVSTTVKTVVLVVQAQSRSLGSTDRRDQANWRMPSEYAAISAAKSVFWHAAG
jgi:hypothetical protein